MRFWKTCSNDSFLRDISSTHGDIPASSKVGLISAFCPINRFFTRTTFLGKPEFLLIYCCQARFSAAKMPDQTTKIPDQTAKIPDQKAKIPDHVGWQFLTTAFIFRNGVFPQERRQFYCFWATAEISTIWKIQVSPVVLFVLTSFVCWFQTFFIVHFIYGMSSFPLK